MSRKKTEKVKSDFCITNHNKRGLFFLNEFYMNMNAEPFSKLFCLETTVTFSLQILVWFYMEEYYSYQK